MFIQAITSEVVGYPQFYMIVNPLPYSPYEKPKMCAYRFCDHTESLDEIIAQFPEEGQEIIRSFGVDQIIDHYKTTNVLCHQAVVVVTKFFTIQYSLVPASAGDSEDALKISEYQQMFLGLPRDYPDMRELLAWFRVRYPQVCHNTNLGTDLFSTAYARNPKLISYTPNEVDAVSRVIAEAIPRLEKQRAAAVKS